MDRLTVHHDKSKDTVFVAWFDKLSSGTLELTPEEAQMIGRTGSMAKASKDQKRV